VGKNGGTNFQKKTGGGSPTPRKKLSPPAPLWGGLGPFLKIFFFFKKNNQNRKKQSFWGGGGG